MYYFSRYPLTDALIAAGLIFGAMYLRVTGPQIDNVAVLFAIVFAFAIRNIGMSIWVATFHPRPAGMTWSARFSALGAQQLGFKILKAMAVAAGVIALDKGKEMGPEVLRTIETPYLVALLLVALAVIAVWATARYHEAPQR
jgi:hypothetical protein